MVNIRKRGKVYQYQFEIAKVDEKRKYISKSGFKTKNEALMAGMKVYDEYINGGNTKDSQMSYADYLDYWMKEYFEINYKYSTAKRYKETFKVLKEEIGKYKLSFITPFLLNQSLLKIAQKCKTKEGVRNYQKVIKSSFRDATNHFGFLKYNPAVELQIPKILSFETKKNGIKHIYSQEEIDRILLRFKNNNTFICAFLTACYTGMRTGEVFALTWDDIDLENKIIKINKTVYSKIKDDKGGLNKVNDTIIYLVRHAETVDENGIRNTNEDSQMINEKEILSVEGEEQAKKLSENIELKNLDIIWSSSYTRAKATAKYIANVNNLPFNLDSNLSERKLGNLKELGKFMKDKSTRDPSQEQLLDRTFRTSDGESAEQTRERMNKFFDKILKEYEGKRIAVISHGGSIKFFLLNWCTVNENVKLVYNNEKILNIKSPCLLKLTFRENELIDLEQID